jgi:hypothetical protein
MLKGSLLLEKKRNFVRFKCLLAEQDTPMEWIKAKAVLVYDADRQQALKEKLTQVRVPTLNLLHNYIVQQVHVAQGETITEQTPLITLKVDIRPALLKSLRNELYGYGRHERKNGCGGALRFGNEVAATALFNVMATRTGVIQKLNVKVGDTIRTDTVIALINANFKKTYKLQTLNADVIDGFKFLRPWVAVAKEQHGAEFQPSMFSPHITIVKGQEPVVNKTAWGKYEGEILEFEYLPTLEEHYNFWYLPVRCQRMFDIRAELGLSHKHNLHITVGRILHKS